MLEIFLGIIIIINIFLLYKYISTGRRYRKEAQMAKKMEAEIDDIIETHRKEELQDSAKAEERINKILNLLEDDDDLFIDDDDDFNDYSDLI